MGRLAAKNMQKPDWLIGRGLCVQGELILDGPLQAARDAVAKMTDPAERGPWTTYVEGAIAMYTYEMKGPPELGGWDGVSSHASAFETKLRALQQGVPGDTPAAKLAALREFAAYAATEHALALKLKATPCAWKLARGWWEGTSPSAVKANLGGLAQPILWPDMNLVGTAIDAYDRAAGLATPTTMAALSEAQAKHWDAYQAAIAAKPAVARLTPFVDLLAPADGDNVKIGIARLDEVIAKEPVWIKNSLDLAGGLPPKAGNQALAKQARASIQDDVRELRVIGALEKGTEEGRERYDETHDRIWNNYYQTYPIAYFTPSLPASWTELPGITRADVCVVVMGGMKKYTKGRKVEIGKWRYLPGQGGYYTWCKNKDKPLTLPLW